MSEHNIFQKSFSGLHASGDTLQEVLKRANCRKGPKGISKRFAVLIAATIAVFSMALAAHATGLLGDLVAFLTPAKNPGQMIEGVFGTDISTEKPNMEDAYGNPIEAPIMERQPVDLTETEKLIGAYVSDVDGILSIGENTFTLKSFLIDETGSGAITWTAENPNGINYRDAGYGMVSFNSSSPFDNPTMYHYGADGSKKKSTDMYTALISKNEAGTKLELVSYFGTFDKYQIGDSFGWMVSRNRKQEAQKIKITPAQHIPAKAMTAAEGMRLTLSNHSITFDFNSDHDYIQNRIVIHFRDGSEYCLTDDEGGIYNTPVSFSRSSDTYRYDDTVYLFNRIIDTDQVASVEWEGHLREIKFNGKGWDDNTYTKHFIFYPA